MKIIINKKIYEIEYANTFIKRFIGLMGKKKITKGIFFPKTRSIHTFFMKDMIDVIIINKENNIIYYQKCVKPNRIIIKGKGYHTIELPKGRIDKITINDKIIIEEN